MTVENSDSKVRYVANGTTKRFDVPFKFFNNEDGTAQLAVNLGNDDNPSVVLTENEDYTVEGAGEESGGAIILNVAPAANMIIVILRQMPFTQDVNFMNGEDFDGEQYEMSLDEIIMTLQQMAELQSRAVTIDPLSEEDPNTLIQQLLGYRNEAVKAANDAFTSKNEAAASAEDAAESATQAQEILDNVVAAGETQVTNINNAGTTNLNNINNAGTTQVANVNNAGTTNLNNINSAGTTQVNNVNTAGDNQVARVVAEGDTQVARVKAEGDAQVDRVVASGDEAILEATKQADRAEEEADRSETGADRATTEADRAEDAATNVSNKEDKANKKTVISDLDGSDTNYPSTGAVVGYVKGVVASWNNGKFKGKSYWYGKMTADFVPPSPADLDDLEASVDRTKVNYIDFTTNTVYKALADLSGWEVREVIEPLDQEIVSITKQFWDIQESGLPGTAQFSETTGEWTPFPESVTVNELYRNLLKIYDGNTLSITPDQAISVYQYGPVETNPMYPLTAVYINVDVSKIDTSKIPTFEVLLDLRGTYGQIITANLRDGAGIALNPIWLDESGGSWNAGVGFCLLVFRLIAGRWIANIQGTWGSSNEAPDAGNGGDIFMGV